MTRENMTLCAIAGNAEQYINRFLDWAFKLTPNVVIVRAIGNQKADKTLEIAAARGCDTDEYFNHPMQQGKDRDGGYSDCWPHVDNFAAARNFSFSLADTEFIMWADLDDLMDDESIAATLDALARMPDGYDGLEIPYRVPEDGLTVFRERIIRRGAAKWVSPIHEHLQFINEPRLVRITNGHVLHAPIGGRKSNDERNLRILESIPRDEMTASHRFHLFQSLRAVGRMEDAATECVSILRDRPANIGRNEIYELFIAAGQMSPEVETRANLMLQAVGTDPRRREAYGEAALACMAMSKFEDALAWSTTMRRLPPPQGGVWNIRKKYYGYSGEQIHGMALRACGKVADADANERAWFIAHGARISLIHATRGRPEIAVKARREWFEKAENPDAIEHVFGLDADDESAVYMAFHNSVILPGDGGPVAAWNAAAKKSTGKILVQVSDDWKPPLHWDRMILDAIGDPNRQAVLAVSDGHRTDDLLCMAIMTRARYRKQGYMFHPDFWSMYSDNWFSHCAFRDGVVIDARDRITFEHNHPAFGKAPNDWIYDRSNSAANYAAGQAIFENLKACEK